MSQSCRHFPRTVGNVSVGPEPSPRSCGLPKEQWHRTGFKTSNTEIPQSLASPELTKASLIGLDKYNEEVHIFRTCSNALCHGLSNPCPVRLPETTVDQPPRGFVLWMCDILSGPQWSWRQEGSTVSTIKTVAKPAVTLDCEQTLTPLLPLDLLASNGCFHNSSSSQEGKTVAVC
jgi:hypothetical protein